MKNKILRNYILNFTIFILVSACILCSIKIPVNAADDNSALLNKLHAKYAVLMDADNGRVLCGKNPDTQVPMASTTKIMTCIIALEFGDEDLICTTSSYAASMPDVQLNAVKGQQFRLNDLLYSLMLKSHNDTAVIIAENVAYHYIFNVFSGNNDSSVLKKYNINPNLYEFVKKDNIDTEFIKNISKEQSKLLVRLFTTLMNEKARTLGCTNTHFVTPNGLDGADENGIHSTTARELAIIMSYCIKNDNFLNICQTKSHSFDKYTIGNSNAFLNMYDHIIAGKTGFTADAGYCYVCTYSHEGRTFIVTLLACGWPNNKNYKWHDSRILLEYAREAYFKRSVDINDYISVQPSDLRINVTDSNTDSIGISYENKLSLLLSDSDVINCNLSLPDTITAPVSIGETIGHIDVFINDSLYKSVAVIADDNVSKNDFLYYCIDLLKKYMFIDK